MSQPGVDGAGRARRSCDSCTACCDGWLSSELIEMSPGHPCKHCGPEGCGIYSTRPRSPCRTFECAWLRAGSNLPDHLRPDRCGAIVMRGRSYRSWIVTMATPTGWVIPQPTLDWLMADARRSSVPLIWIENLHDHGVYTHFKRSGFGPAEFIQAITSPDEDLDIRVI